MIGLDLLGHGNADKPHEPAAYEDLEGDVAAALPEDPSVKIDAIGFSMGAILLLKVASAHPERFERIVVGGIGSNVFAEGGSEAIARAVEGDVSGESPALARVFAQFAAGSDNDPKALAACMRRNATPLTPDDLARVNCPVLVVVGDQDFVWPPDPLLHALPNAKLVTLAGVDHFATPREFKFIDAALEFLDALP